jgi:hypothetical protein
MDDLIENLDLDPDLDTDNRDDDNTISILQVWEGERYDSYD